MRRELLVGFLLIAAVTLIYWPVHSYPFVLLDDPGYVCENPAVRDGLTAEGVGYAFTGVTVGNWHPLTMLSHMLDCQLYGSNDQNAGKHHLTSLALHVANTLLLFIALRRMTGAVWRSGFAAALFGLHPLHVESVAWISERKDVLSTFFFMLMLLAYHEYAKRPGLFRYIVVFVLLLLGLLSKPMLVTAPLVLLLLDYWPLGRMAAQMAGSTEQEAESAEDQESSAGQATDSEEQGVVTEDPQQESDEPVAAFRSPSSAFWPLVVEKIPLFIIVGLCGLITMFVQRGSGAMGMLGQSLPLVTRLGNAVCAYGIYVEKIFWPHPLAVLYPYTTHKLVDMAVIGAALVAITIAAYRLSRIKPYLPVGWGWYLITLVPVIGIVQVGVQSMADRYTYIPLIGLFIIAAWGGAELAAGFSATGKAAAIVAACAALGICAWLTAQQVTAWSSSVALFKQSVDAIPDNYVALNNLGLAYWQLGRLDDAQQQFETIVKMESDPHLHLAGGLEPAHRNLGLLLAVRHKPAQALYELGKAIELQPRQPDARRHMAWLLATYPDEQVRNGKEAVRLAEQAMNLSASKPPEIWDTLAVAEAENFDFEKAAAAEEKAIEVARQTRADTLLPELQQRLKMFKSGNSYHEEPRRPTRM
jgi:hypothetical protein